MSHLSYVMIGTELIFTWPGDVKFKLCYDRHRTYWRYWPFHFLCLLHNGISLQKTFTPI